MASYFTCPKCRQNSYANYPQGSAYAPNLRCKRCGLEGINWFADQATADRAVANHGFARELIAVGVGQSPIKHMEPDFATGDLKATIEPQFKDVATLVVPYNQRSRLQNITPHQADVQAGVCMGQCLHWIRRVLQGINRESYKVPAQKNGVTRTDEQIVAKQIRQHMGGVAAQQAFRANQFASNARYLNALQQMAPALNQRGIRVHANGSYEVTGTNAEMDAKDALMADVKAKLMEKVNRLDYNWSDLAATLDGTIANKHKYSSMLMCSCVQSKQGEKYGDADARSYAMGVLLDPEFVQGRAAVLSVGLAVGTGEDGSPIPGHAIAVFYAAPDAFFLFDPNVGVLRAYTRANLAKAIIILLDQVWSSYWGWRLNGSFGYSVFRVETPAAARKPRERPVPLNTGVPVVDAIEAQAVRSVPVTPFAISAPARAAQIVRPQLPRPVTAPKFGVRR